jgi:hypothetical protein
MILPSKHIRLENSLIGVGAEIVKRIKSPQTVSQLWNDMRNLPGVRTFERFTLSLDLLFALGAIDFEEGLLRREIK